MTELKMVSMSEIRQESVKWLAKKKIVKHKFKFVFSALSQFRGIHCE
jgi:hypothetical protein